MEPKRFATLTQAAALIAASVIAIRLLSFLMIAIIESFPPEQWAGIAYALLCYVAPVCFALALACGGILIHVQMQLNKLRGER